MKKCFKWMFVVLTISIFCVCVVFKEYNRKRDKLIQRVEVQEILKLRA